MRGPPPAATPPKRTSGNRSGAAGDVPPSPSGPGAASPDAPEHVQPISLIALERPFDVDEFAQLLGETVIQVTVPREDLVEVLRRISEFMNFGIYVYSVEVRPAPSELLKEFVVVLHRVDYSPTTGDWAPFQEKGRSDSPFGPGSTR
ncbi:MAG: hypothetical protein WCA77_06600 [Thermoplasmata archaeon]